jgi:LysR family transcriptional regulator, hydrogen peroxide-inducible genes activator
MSLTLRQMHYALTLVETGHFGRAAERCHITQPALSQQIRQLEDFCGAPLFDRLGKSVRPTPIGREFAERARGVLEQAQLLEDFLRGAHGRPTRPLRFGLIPTIAPYLLHEIYPALQAELPDLQFTAHESRTDQLLDGLEDGSIDLALIASTPPPQRTRLTLAPLFVDEFVLATSEAGDDPVPLATIDSERMLLLDEGHCFRDQAIAACGLGANGSRRAFAATSLSTIVEFVANGQGITLLPEIALKKEAVGDRIHIRRLVSPGAHRMLQLAWREATPFAALFDQVATAIRRLRPHATGAAPG